MSSINDISNALHDELPIPNTIGDYQVTELVGSGGMGVVYKAIQPGVERVVALKVMNGEAVSSGPGIKRFQKEVRAAANLHHTNIVPVFEVGDAEKHYFYSMQFIDGIGVDHAIDSMRERQDFDLLVGFENPTTNFSKRRTNGLAETLEFDAQSPDPRSDVARTATEIPKTAVSEDRKDEGHASRGTRPATPDSTYFKQVARIGIQIAEALQYAHVRGTIHRDIKPHNLLIDRSEIAWVTDFGLATSVADYQSADNNQIAGTLRYMAPEQLNGVTDARSDVYSLGLTLYEMLTLRSAFGHGDESYSFSDRLRDKNAPSIRNYCPNIPRDLKAIVMKSISFAARDRYQMAQSLAIDLRSFLRGQPVTARRTTAFERLWKWICRNPALATAFATIFVLLAVFSTMASIGRARVQNLLMESQASTTLSQSRLNLATNAFDDILLTYADQRVVAETELSMDNTRPVDAPVTIADIGRLELLLSFYEKFAEGSPNNQALHIKIATAKGRLGDVQMRLGQLDKAENTFENVVEWIEEHNRQSSDDLTLIEAQALNELGMISLKRGEFATAVQQHYSALEILRSNAKDLVADEAAFETARTTYLLSSLIERSGVRFDETNSRRNARRQINRAQRRTSPVNRMNDTVQLFEKTGTLLNLGETEQPPNADGERPVFDVRSRVRSLARFSVIEFQKLVEVNPKEERFRLALASASQNFASSISVLDPDLARSSFRNSVLLLEKLVEETDRKPVYLYELAVCLSQSRKFVGDQEATLNLNKAIQECRQLASRFPSNYEYEYLESLSTTELAAVFSSAGNVSEAESLLRSAVSRLSSLVLRIPDRSSLRLVLAQGRQQLANVLVSQSLEASDAERSRLKLEIIAILNNAIKDLDHDSVANSTSFLRTRIENSLKQSLEEASRRMNSESDGGGTL